MVGLRQGTRKGVAFPRGDVRLAASIPLFFVRREVNRVDDLLKASEVAQRLRVCRRTVTRWLADGQLKGQKVGGEWRVTEFALRQFLEKGKHEK